MLNDRVDYKSITLLEVANRCNIGKSTIYEYFSSKDEMIYGSIIYYLNNTIKFFSENIEITTFRVTLKTFIKALFIIMKSNYWMVMPWTFLDNYSAFLSDQDSDNLYNMLNKCQEIIYTLFSSIMDKGEEEGTLFSSNDESKRFAFNGLVLSITEEIEHVDLENMDNEPFINNMVSCIIKQLN